MSEDDNVPNNWPVVLWYIHISLLGSFGLWALIVYASWFTVLYAILLISLGCISVTVGAHRLWAHRTFEASILLRAVLLVGHTLAGVGSLYDFVLYHRLHHKHYGTELDPYNHKKGFIHCHYVVNMQFAKTDAESQRIKKEVNMVDMESDMLIMLQKKLYWLWFIIGTVVPVYIPIAYWNEWVLWSIVINCFLRYAITLNVAWLVNSAFVIWNLEDGEKYPPADNLIFFVNRTRWLGYHYLFPWDYKSGEFGCYDHGWGSCIINILRDVGLVTYAKTVSPEHLREVFFNMNDKKFSLREAIYNLKHMSQDEVQKRHLIFRG